MAAVNYTTGPISSSEDMDLIRIEVLNNTGSRRTANVILFDLSFSPKRQLLSQNVSMARFSVATIDVPASGLDRWEVQVRANTTSIRPWVGGKRQGQNVTGTVVLNSQFVRF